jgi:hypothetical protein
LQGFSFSQWWFWRVYYLIHHAFLRGLFSTLNMEATCSSETSIDLTDCTALYPRRQKCSYSWFLWKNTFVRWNIQIKCLWTRIMLQWMCNSGLRKKRWLLRCFTCLLYYYLPTNVNRTTLRIFTRVLQLRVHCIICARQWTENHTIKIWRCFRESLGEIPGSVRLKRIRQLRTGSVTLLHGEQAHPSHTSAPLLQSPCNRPPGLVSFTFKWCAHVFRSRDFRCFINPVRFPQEETAPPLKLIQPGTSKHGEAPDSFVYT